MPEPRRAARRKPILRPFQRPLPIDSDLDETDPSAPAIGRRRTAHVHRSDPGVLAMIAAGGFLGTVARYGVGQTFAVAPDAFPWPTFAINTSGAFALGWLLTCIIERWQPGHFLRPLTCVGFLGAWTTMSALAAQADVLAKDGHAVLAVTYILGTLLAGATATTAGILLAPIPFS